MMFRCLTAKMSFITSRFVVSTLPRFQTIKGITPGTVTYCTKSTTSQNKDEFDVSMLEYLVCPLSKAPLRYDKENHVLVCDDIAVSYPIINGIPNLVPQDARKLHSESSDARD